MRPSSLVFAGVWLRLLRVFEGKVSRTRRPEETVPRWPRLRHGQPQPGAEPAPAGCRDGLRPAVGGRGAGSGRRVRARSGLCAVKAVPSSRVPGASDSAGEPRSWRPRPRVLSTAWLCTATSWLPAQAAPPPTGRQGVRAASAAQEGCPGHSPGAHLLTPGLAYSLWAPTLGCQPG